MLYTCVCGYVGMMWLRETKICNVLIIAGMGALRVPGGICVCELVEHSEDAECMYLVQVGDVAGVGCFTDSCRSCEECKEGDENPCTGAGGMHGTYGSERPEEQHPGGVTQGGYSGDIVVDQNYVIKVPENMHVAAAAPLLCAGITCYSPFMNHGIKAGQNLGIVGLGGLGHMAVKIGAAMGCNVTVITRDESKRELALSFGAKNVIISTDKAQMDAAAKTLHFIYNSIAFAHDIHQYLDLLKSNGTIIMVGGVPQGAMPAGSFSLIPRNLRVAGSLIGGIKQTQEMIDFCSKHNIVCSIEMIEATPEAVEIAWKRTVASDVKFRFVIDTKATLPKLA